MNAKGIIGARRAIIWLGLAVVFVFVMSLFFIAQPQGNPGGFAHVDAAVTAPIQTISAYAFQDPTNSSQVSALALIVQPSGTNSTDFTCRKITIALATDNQVQYANVYTTNNFVNASTFNTTYYGSFSNYQEVAPNCSIIELNGNGDQMLQPGDTFAVFINLGQLNCTLQPYDTVTVQITPSSGATLTCTYSMPANIAPVMVLSGT